MSLGKSSGKTTTSNNSTSAPLTPEEVAAYYAKLNEQTGGRLSMFAMNGTPAVNYGGASYTSPGAPETASYAALTPDQIKALGGLGATRAADVNRARAEAVQQITADPNLTLAQRQRSTQLNDQDTQARLDAINKETEAAITGLSSQEAQRQYESTKAAADTKNAFASTEAQRQYTAASEEAARKYQAELAQAGLTAKDLELLANIFFGGKGQTSDTWGGGISRNNMIQFGVGK